MVTKYIPLQSIESPLVMKVAGRSDFQGAHVPSWLEYLRLVAESKQKNYLGLLLPVYLGCDPCNMQYDAVVRMETFNADSRFRQAGLSPSNFSIFQDYFERSWPGVGCSGSFQ